jgi:hypothetical protein
METQLKHTNHLKSGLVFGLLTILFFIFHLIVEIPTNSDPSIQYSIDTGAVVLQQNALFIFLASLCSLFFAISFAKYSFNQISWRYGRSFWRLYHHESYLAAADPFLRSRSSVALLLYFKWTGRAFSDLDVFLLCYGFCEIEIAGIFALFPDFLSVFQHWRFLPDFDHAEHAD